MTRIIQYEANFKAVEYLKAVRCDVGPIFISNFRYLKYDLGQAKDLFLASLPV